MTFDRDRSVFAGGSSTSRSATREAFSRVVSGDLDALGVLYDLEADRLFALALWVTGSREDAADAVQDVFVRIVTRRGMERVREPRAYLLAMARSAAVDRMRSVRPEEPADDLVIASEAAGPESDPESAVEARAASRFLRRLPPAQREAVYLRYFEELSFAEIGRVTGVSLFTAASRCRLGIRKLRRWMGVTP